MQLTYVLEQGIVWVYMRMVLRLQLQHTLTGGYTPRPHSCNLTCALSAAHKVVAWITTVGGCLSKCCSSSTNLAISWVSQNATVHNCQRIDICIHVCLYVLVRCYIMLIAIPLEAMGTQYEHIDYFVCTMCSYVLCSRLKL